MEARERWKHITINIPLPLFQRLDRYCTADRTKQDVLYPVIAAKILSLPAPADGDDRD